MAGKLLQVDQPPSCMLVLLHCLFVYVWVTITRNCMHRSSPNWVCR